MNMFLDGFFHVNNSFLCVFECLCAQALTEADRIVLTLGSSLKDQVEEGAGVIVKERERENCCLQKRRYSGGHKVEIDSRGGPLVCVTLCTSSFFFKCVCCSKH